MDLNKIRINDYIIKNSELKLSWIIKRQKKRTLLSSDFLSLNFFGNVPQKKWWAMTGSNCRHLPCKGSALPAELIALRFEVELE